MNPWETYLASLDPSPRAEVLAWYESRPPGIRDLMRRFPPGSRGKLHDGRRAFVVGYAETEDEGGEPDEPGLLMSYTDPNRDYQQAVAGRFFVCGSHFAESRS